jgi:hypothetical protein
MAFTNELSLTDRRRLRSIVRKVHLGHYPAHMLTNHECDKLIDAWGPEVAGNIVRKAVDRGMVA